MAYFQKNEAEDTRRHAPVDAGTESLQEPAEYIESEYDDGFDPPPTEEEILLSEEEQKEIRKKRFQIASGAGNLTGIITGAVVILLLLAFLMNMINFVMNDVERNFTLFQNRF